MPVIYVFGPFRLDAQANMLYRETTPVALGLRAVTLLRVLVEQRGVLVAKETLIDAAWPGLAIEDSNLTVQIAALRRALGTEPGAERWIETLPRRGYRFCGPAVTRQDGEETQRQPAAPAASPPSPGAPSPPALAGGVPVTGLAAAPTAERRLVHQADEACHPSSLAAENGASGRASRARFAGAIEPLERGALWVFRRTGWLPSAPGQDGRSYLPAAMLLLATTGLLAAFWLSASHNRQALVAASTDATLPRPPLPSSRFDVPVTILPFTTALGAPPPGLGEHIANDLAAHLPRSTTLRVVPHQGSSGPAPDFKAIGTRLGVRYVVTGTISTQDQKLRVSVALIDTRHGSQVWELHATEDRGHWPSVHEEFIHRTTFAIHFQALRRAGNEPTDPDKEPTVDQLLGRGHAALLDSSDSPRFGEAEAAFREVLRREPEAVPAMIGLANYYIQSVADLRIDREPHLTQAEELLRRALTMRTHYYPVHYQLALLHNLQGNLTAALEELDQVIELYPSHAPSYARKGRVLIRLQRHEEALKNIRHGMRINGGTIVPGWQLWHGWAALELGRDEEALEEFNRALGALPRNPYVQASLAAVHALKGEREAARQQVIEMRKRTPQLTDEQRLIEFNKGPDNRALRNRLGEGLRLAIEIAGNAPDN